MYKVMLAEDEDWILKGLCGFLDWEALGFKIVHTAHNGQEALDRWDEEPVDLIVTDVNMPVMNGLTLLQRVREKNDRVRFLILTGHDEFEYARTAMRLGVDEYILKPIDEEELINAVRKAGERLAELAGERFGHMAEQVSLQRFLEGKDGAELHETLLRPAAALLQEGPAACVLMSLDMDSLPAAAVAKALKAIGADREELAVYPLGEDSLVFFLLLGEEGEEGIVEKTALLQEELEERFGLLSFAAVSGSFTTLSEVPERYEAARRLQRYRLVEGFGSVVDEKQMMKRRGGDRVLDENMLSRLILQKDKIGASRYLDSLFINNVHGDTSADEICRLAVKTAMLLQEIKREYQLTGNRELSELSEMIGGICRAGSLAALKAVLVREILGLIDTLNTEESQYTPVIRQILSDVDKDYKGDMNLKTLAHKYRMNTSYLGQVFQKEVGFTFSRYLSNKKNSRAKELILTTNRKITEIAEEVGYPDTSYFYRKFKQTYGVSPAALREMRKF